MLAGEPDALNVKVCDFGLAAVKNRDSDELTMSAGTPQYMAPEVLENRGSYSPLCDVWSIGVMLHALITGVLPFRPERSERMLDSILRTELAFDAPALDEALSGLKV